MIIEFPVTKEVKRRLKENVRKTLRERWQSRKRKCDDEARLKAFQKFHFDEGSYYE